jgi:hypothetical protein
VVEIHEGICGPKLLPQRGAGNGLSRLFQQHGQHLKRLLLQFDLAALPAQFSGVKINLDQSKLN